MKTKSRAEKLRSYGGRMVMVDGKPTVELKESERFGRVFQYRRADPVSIEKRILGYNRQPLRDWKTGLPDASWETISADDLISMWRVRGSYHPILTPLALTPKDVMAAIKFEERSEPEMESTSETSRDLDIEMEP